MNLAPRIGTAGWAIPKAHTQSFTGIGSALERYASIFNAAEINSTFYRPHRSSTLERWRDSVPDDFRFSVKVAKTITHELRLVDAGQEFATFAASLAGLGDRLGPLLLQLPPKLPFDAAVVDGFFTKASSTGQWQFVLEPRNETWFSAEADALLEAHGVARAGADPERSAGALRPGGSRRMTYLRLHGSPRTYYSSYDDAFIDRLSRELDAAAGPAWCIFDNTASGAATGDALRLLGGPRIGTSRTAV